VDKVLSRLAEESGEAKDLRTSEIMAVYEHKFKSLSMKENHLQVPWVWRWGGICYVLSMNTRIRGISVTLVQGLAIPFVIDQILECPCPQPTSAF
jgi:hypothetical protein